MKRKQKEVSVAPLSYTQQINLEKREENFWNKLFQPLPENLTDLPTHINWINLSFTDVSDEDLSFLVSRIKSINMLDLKDTAITFKGIEHLTKLENLSELRLKESANIDDECMNFLVQLTTLTLLQINDTSITPLGLTNIAALHNLKRLYLSLDIKEVSNQDLLKRIQIKIPGCEIIVNGTLNE